MRPGFNLNWGEKHPKPHCFTLRATLFVWVVLRFVGLFVSLGALCAPLSPTDSSRFDTNRQFQTAPYLRN